MIRIDLGKDSKKRGESLRRIAVQLKLQQPYDELLARFDSDVNRLIAFFISLAVTGLPVLLVAEYQNVVTANYERKISAADKEIAIIDSEIQALMPYKQELDSYETQRAQVNQRIAVIQNLVDLKGTPVTTLDAIGQALPEGVWLETLDFDGTNKTAETISAKGKALSNENISDFVDRLGQSTYLRNVKIESVAAVIENTVDLKTFVLNMEANTTFGSVAPQPARDAASK